MTVIAYRSGIMVSDSLAVDPDTGDVWTFRAPKIFRLPNGALLGTAGDYDARELTDLLSRSTVTKLPSKQQIAELKTSFQGILVFRRGDVFDISSDLVDYEHSEDWEASVCRVPDPFHAVGCGAPWAISAMKLGASSRKAVEHAIEMNRFCGGKIQVTRLNEQPRKRKA